MSWNKWHFLEFISFLIIHSHYDKVHMFSRVIPRCNGCDIPKPKLNSYGSKGTMFGQLCDLVKERGSI